MGLIKDVGIFLKMRSELDSNNLAHYYLALENTQLHMNDYLGRRIELQFSGDIFCLDTGKKIKKSFGQGYSYEAFMRLAQCDPCYMRPELCHFDHGTCREPRWGEQNCMIDTVVYLANTGEAKVGLTRHNQIPYRWIDQGASSAMALVKLGTRKLAGELENELRAILSDRTNWRKMLTGDHQKVDFFMLREQIFSEFAEVLDSLEAQEMETSITNIHYPLLHPPKLIKTFDFDKNPQVIGKFLGIRGQYLILDTGVLNVRKFQGYRIEIVIHE